MRIMQVTNRHKSLLAQPLKNGGETCKQYKLKLK
jgi:hypothetical protein